jgi:hypothetical protein
MNLRELAPRLRREAAVLLLPAAAIVTFGSLVNGREILWGDFVSWYYPSHHYAATRLQNGELPLWNPYVDCGMPFIGEADHGTLYPPSLLLHAIGDRKLALFFALEAFTVGHILWGALSLYVLARSLGCSPWAAAVGGLAFGLSGTFVARASHVSLVCAQAWLPVVLGGLHHAIRGGSRRALALAAAAVGMIALSGSPATLVVTVVGLTAVALATAAATRSEQPLVPGLARAAAFAAFAAGAGVLLGTIQLLPMMELVRSSERSAYIYEEVASYAVGPQSLIMLVLPRFYGWLRYDALHYWGPENFAELSGYTGVLTMAAAAAGLAFAGLRRTAPWLAVAVVGFWLALGAHGGLHWLFYKLVPVLGEMRAPGRFLLLWACGLAVVAALGFDIIVEGLRAGDARIRRFVAVAAGAVGILAIAVALWRPAGLLILDDWTHLMHLEGCRRALWATLATVAALGAALRFPQAAAPVLACALAFDVAVQWKGVGLHPRADILQVIGPAPPHLQPSLADRSLHRVGSRFTNPGQMMMARVQTTAGPGRHLLHYQAYSHRIASRSSPLYDLLNIRYVAESTNDSVEAPGPNLIVSEGIWLADGLSVDIPVDPPVRSEGVELMLTASARGIPDGTLMGEIELVGPDGSEVRPIRLGIETGEFDGRADPSAATRVPVDHYVNVADAGTLLRVHYRYALRLDRPRRVSAVRMRHPGGPAALVVKELRLFRAPDAIPSWRSVITGERYGDFGIRLHENLDAVPRAWLARAFVLASSYEEAWRRMSELDLRQDVAIEIPAGRTASDYPAPPADGRTRGAATVTHYAPEAITVTAEAPAPGAWLVLSEVTYPGWTATVDGRPTEIARADGLFRAVWLPPGPHEVALRYRPASFYRGAMVSGFTALALLATAAWTRRRTAAPA